MVVEMGKNSPGTNKSSFSHVFPFIQDYFGHFHCQTSSRGWLGRLFIHVHDFNGSLGTAGRSEKPESTQKMGDAWEKMGTSWEKHSDI